MSGPLTTRDVLGLLARGEPLSIADIARRTGTSRSTVKTRLDDAVRAGLATETDEAVSTGGRPSALFRLNPAATILGIDVGTHHSMLGLLDLYGTPRSTVEFSMDIEAGPEPILDDVVARSVAMLTAADMSMYDVAAVGIGLPGPIEFASGRPVSPPIMPGWDSFDVRAYMEARFGVPVVVDNDVNLAALGERTARWGDADDFIYVKVGTGIGAGIVTRGELLRGALGTAGDIGHIQVTSGGRWTCRCGRLGCLEAEASGTAILRELRAGAESTAETLDDVVALISRGDPKTLALIRNAGLMIGGVLAACVNILNPAVIVVGGAIAGESTPLIDGVREAVNARSLNLATRDLVIEHSVTGPLAVLRGAGVLAAQHLFSDAHLATAL
jgi:glucokinase